MRRSRLGLDTDTVEPTVKTLLSISSLENWILPPIPYGRHSCPGRARLSLGPPLTGMVPGRTGVVEAVRSDAAPRLTADPLSRREGEFSIRE
eukprot:36419-Pyramimonas_sp.AAC.1